MIIKTPEAWNLTKDRVLVDGEIQRVGPQIAQIVAHSFLTHPMRNPTQNEHADRVNFLTKLYFERRQQKWTELRAVSSLRGALVAHLDKAKSTPRAQGFYVRDQLLYPGAAPSVAIALGGESQ